MSLEATMTKSKVGNVMTTPGGIHVIRIQKGLQVNAIIAHKNIKSFDTTIVLVSPALLLVSISNPPSAPEHLVVQCPPSYSLRANRAHSVQLRPISYVQAWRYPAHARWQRTPPW